MRNDKDVKMLTLRVCEVDCVCWCSHPDFVKSMHVIKCGMHLLLAREGFKYVI